MFKFIALSLFIRHSSCIQDMHPDCRDWAERDDECANNPRFMWGKCHTSCLAFSVNDNELCDQWAKNGECSANIQYVPQHCPVSCGYSIAWNVWQRRSLNIDDVTPTIGDNTEPCRIPLDVFGAAEIMRLRLNKFVLEGNEFTVGFSASAGGGEFSGMAGLADAVLYAFRLYMIVITEVGSSQLQAQYALALTEIRAVLTPPNAWSSDNIMINIPKWIRSLNTASENIRTLVELSPTVNSSSDQSLYECPSLKNGPKITTIPVYQNPQYTAAPTLGNINYSPSLDLESITLSNGIEMPIIGLGTWQLNGPQCEQAVYDAIKIGYRMIDGAQAYGNDKEIGAAVKRAIDEGIVRRSELFIATKLSDEDNDAGYAATKALVTRQLADFGLDYFDLYLIHSPMKLMLTMQETWLAMEELYAAGTIKALGLSNFGASELESVLNMKSLTVPPMVIQNKWDIYHIGKQIDPAGDLILTLAKKNGIRMVAYSPLSSFPFTMKPADDPIVHYIASTKSGSTPAQVVLRWIIQQGVAVIPRSTSPLRLLENLAVAHKEHALSAEEIGVVSSISHLTTSPISIAVNY